MSGRRPLRVTYLDHVARLSGAEIALTRLIEAAGSELEATVILAEDGELVEQLVATGATVEVLPLAEEVRGMRRGEMRPGLRQARAAAEVARYAARLRGRLRELRPPPGPHDLAQGVRLRDGRRSRRGLARPLAPS